VLAPQGIGVQVPSSAPILRIRYLPALRNVQPNVPGMGVLRDYISFIWAELMVSMSAIALAWNLDNPLKETSKIKNFTCE
jgi:hypothetical protein